MDELMRMRANNEKEKTSKTHKFFEGIKTAGRTASHVAHKAGEVAGNVADRTRFALEQTAKDPIVRKLYEAGVRAGKNQAEGRTYAFGMGAPVYRTAGGTRKKHRVKRVIKVRRRRKHKGMNVQIKPSVQYIPQQAPQTYETPMQPSQTISMDNYPSYP